MKAKDLNKLTSLSNISLNSSELVLTATKMNFEKIYIAKNSGNIQIIIGRSLKALNQRIISILNTLKTKIIYHL